MSESHSSFLRVTVLIVAQLAHGGVATVFVTTETTVSLCTLAQSIAAAKNARANFRVQLWQGQFVGEAVSGAPS